MLGLLSRPQIRSLRSSLISMPMRYVGIDIGGSHVHVASMGPSRSVANSSRSGAKLPFQWLSRTEFELPTDPQQPSSDSLINDVCDTLIEKLPRCVDGERHIACLSLPIPWVHYETTNQNELEDCQKNCDTMFQESLFRSDAHLSHWPVCDGKPKQLVAATSKAAACRVAQAVTTAGFEVQHIVPHGVALLQSAAALTRIEAQVAVVLQQRGGVVATTNGLQCGMCRNLPAVGTTAASVQTIEDLDPWIETVAQEITATCRYAERIGVAFDFDRPVLLAGEIAEIDGVAETLASYTNLPIAVWRFAERLRPIGSIDAGHDARHRDPRRAVAVSLAYWAAHHLSKGVAA